MGTATRKSQVWGINKYTGKRGTSYRVRWSIEGKRMSRSFPSRKLADTFRSMLMVAVRDGTAFDRVTGLPITETPETPPQTWVEFASEYVATRWPSMSPRHRKGVAEALTGISLAIIDTGSPRLAEFKPVELRTALTYGFFARGEPPADFRPEIVRALTAASPLATVIGDPRVVRRIQLQLSTKLDGTPAAERTSTRKLATLHNVLEFAVELEILDANPLPKTRTRNFSSGNRVDPRVVVNRQQGDCLLDATHEITPQLTAYFALLLLAGLRPAEARSILRTDLDLPRTGWGKAVLSRTEQRPGAAWTDDGRPKEERGLKHRSESDVRVPPLSPQLVKILRRHLREFPCGPNGELFAARTGKAGRPVSPPFHSLVSDNTIYRAWTEARAAALPTELFRGALARRPYDLRHACLTHWLNAGVAPAQVATWAGHSTRVLLDVYAGCIDGGEQAALTKIERHFDD